MNMMRFSVFILLVLSNVAVASNFRVLEQTDPMTDEVSVSAFTFGEDSIGLRCDSGEELLLIFSSSSHVATPNSHVEFMVRADKNKPHTLSAKTYTNSYKGGFSKSPSNKLIEELKNSNKAIIQIHNNKRLESQYIVNLKGSYVAFSKVLANCGSVEDKKFLIEHKHQQDNERKLHLESVAAAEKSAAKAKKAASNECLRKASAKLSLPVSTPSKEQLLAWFDDGVLNNNDFYELASCYN
jgi:hypothetical protein